MVPEELYAKPGAKILPKFNALLHWIRRQRLMPASNNVQVSETAHGTLVSYEDRPLIVPHPWQVNLVGSRGFYLSEDSFVNGQPPLFYDETAGDYRSAASFLRADNPAKIPAHRLDEEVHIYCVIRFLGEGENPLTSSGFSVIHASVEAFTEAAREANSIGVGEIAMGVPYRNTGKGEATIASAEFYIPIAFLRYGTVHQFVRHNVNYRIYYDSERKRMAYWAA